MLIFTTHNFPFFSRKEVWFYNGEQLKAGAYNMFSAAERVIDSRVQFLEKYQTTLIDLTRSEDELFNAMLPRLREYIRSAGKKNMHYESQFNPTQADCTNLMSSFREMAKSKGITFLSKRWLDAVQQSGNICITKMLYNNTEIVTHVYIFNKEKIVLTNSFHNNAFSDVSMRGEANKLLHWKDILLFKSMDFKYYDFGGINVQKLPGISRFKLNYGGEVKENYRYIQTSQLIYPFIKLLKKLKLN